MSHFDPSRPYLCPLSTRAELLVVVVRCLERRYIPFSSQTALLWNGVLERTASLLDGELEVSDYVREKTIDLFKELCSLKEGTRVFLRKSKDEEDDDDGAEEEKMERRVLVSLAAVILEEEGVEDGSLLFAFIPAHTEEGNLEHSRPKAREILALLGVVCFSE